MDFFTQQDFNFFSGLRKLPYRAENPEHKELGRKLADDSVFGKTKYWAQLLQTKGYEVITSMRWQKSGYFSSYTWARIMLHSARNTKVFFTIGVGSRMNKEAILINTLDYKLDCQRTGVNALDPSMVYIFDKYMSENCPEASLVQLELNEVENWIELIDMTLDFLKAYEKDYLKVSELTLLTDKNHAKKIVRLCWNDNNWTKPSGSQGKSKSRGAAFERDKGYGYEEWLFNPHHIINGYYYGFIQAFNKGAHYGQIFDISVYAIYNERYQNTYYWICRIPEIEVLTPSEQQEAVEEFELRGWLENMRADLNEVGIDNFNFNPIAKNNIINVRYKANPDSYAFYSPPLLIEHPTAEFEDNQHYVLLSKKGPNQIEDLPLSGFLFKAGHNPTKTGTVNGRRRYSDFTMELKHKEVQEYMYNQMLSEFQGTNKQVGTESKTGFGTSVDLVVDCKIEGKTFYEIKTKGSALQCIRESIGQLIEYSLFAKNKHASKLIVVGLVKANRSTIEYMDHIRKETGLNIYYQYYDYLNHNLTTEIC